MKKFNIFSNTFNEKYNTYHEDLIEFANKFVKYLNDFRTYEGNEEFITLFRNKFNIDEDIFEYFDIEKKITKEDIFKLINIMRVCECCVMGISKYNYYNRNTFWDNKKEYVLVSLQFDGDKNIDKLFWEIYSSKNINTSIYMYNMNFIYFGRIVIDDFELPL